VSRRPYAERCCPSHSPTLRPWITDLRMRNPGGRRPTWRGFGARASRTSREIGRQKPELNTSIHFFLRAGGVFLSQAGPRSVLVFLKLSITSLSYGRSPP
jgi:hypothetical protein